MTSISDGSGNQNLGYEITMGFGLLEVQWKNSFNKVIKEEVETG